MPEPARRRGAGAHRGRAHQPLRPRPAVRRGRHEHGQVTGTADAPGGHRAHPREADAGHGRPGRRVDAGGQRRRRRGRSRPGVRRRRRRCWARRWRCIGGAMYAQYRSIKAASSAWCCPTAPPGRRRVVLRQPADRAGHGRDHAARGPQRAGAHRRGVQPGPDAQPHLPEGRHRAGEHRAQARAGGAAARAGRQARVRHRARPTSWPT